MTTPATPPDLAARLDRAIGDPPPATPAPDPRLAGHRALRRRRTTVLGAVVAAVVVVAVGGSLTGGSTQVAVQPAAAPTPTDLPTSAQAPAAVPTPAPITRPPTIPVAQTDPASTSQTRLRDDHWADFRPDGTLELLPDATIVQRIDDPVPTDRQSVALELSRPGYPDAWYLVEFIPGLYPVPTSTTIPAGSGGYPSLQAWVDAIGGPLATPVQHVEDAAVELRADASQVDGQYFAHFYPDGVLVTLPGVTVLDQVTVPFAAQPTEALHVRRADETGSWYVLLTAGGAGIVGGPRGLAHRVEPGDHTYASLRAWATSRDVARVLAEAPLR